MISQGRSARCGVFFFWFDGSLEQRRCEGVQCIYGPVLRLSTPLPPQWVGSPGSTPFPSICKLLAAFLRSSFVFARSLQHFWLPASHLLGTCYLLDDLRSTHTPSKYLRATYSHIYIYVLCIYFLFTTCVLSQHYMCLTYTVPIIHTTHTKHMKHNYRTYHTYNTKHTCHTYHTYLTSETFRTHHSNHTYHTDHTYCHIKHTIPNRLTYHTYHPYNTNHSCHTYHTYHTYQTYHTFQTCHTRPTIHTIHTQHTISHPHHTTGGGGGRSHMGAITHPWGGGGVAGPGAYIYI